MFKFWKLFLSAMLPLYVTDEEREAMLELANSGVENEDEKTARIEAGVETDDEKTARLAAGNETDAEREAREAEEAKSKGSKVVPHARFNEVVMQRNFYAEENAALKKKNEELEAATAAGKKKDEEEEAYDYDSAEDRYLAAIAEGDKKEAKAIRREINEQLQADTEAKVLKNLNLDQRLEQTTTAMTENQMVKAFTTRIEADFPQFNKEHADFNQDLVAETLETYKGYIAGGMAPSKAIEKATKLCAKAEGIDITKAPAAGLSDAATSVAGKKAAEIAAAARRKGAETSSRQPPRTTSGQPGGKGKVIDPDDIDVENLTDEEFDALPESTKKKLRGDELAA